MITIAFLFAALRAFAPSREILLQFIFASFPGGRIAGHGAMVGPWPVSLPMAAITLSEAEVATAVVSGFVVLIGYHFTIGKYIRQQAGVKDVLRAEIAGQPIEIKGVVRYVEHTELVKVLDSYVTSGDLHATEQRLEGKLESNFRALDSKRSASIGNLHDHLAGAVEKLTAQITEVNTAGEHRITKVHDRVNAVAENLAGVRSEMRIVNDSVGSLVRTLQESAIKSLKSPK